ncbi:MAG: hypothetical protein OEL89_00535 [Candidatus Peregrinibacteria bacterium]|nr:hypothetical protein [Candidatus Peregrinibacteria bacterium]
MNVKIGDIALIECDLLINNKITENLWVKILEINGEQIEGEFMEDGVLLTNLKKGTLCLFTLEDVLKIRKEGKEWNT